MSSLITAGRRFALIRRSLPEIAAAIGQTPMPSSPDGYAHDLYAALRSMDEASADVILVEALPLSDDWQGVNDRLRRAAHDSQGILDRLLNKTC